MARIVLTCWGSHGDVDPFLGLGLALQARGHRVAIATIEYYRSLVEGASLGFHPLRPKVDPTDIHIVEQILDPRRGSDFLLRQLLFPAIEDAFEDVQAASEGVDLLISHPITFATPIVAEYRKVPWASVVLAPASMFSAYDFPALPPAPWLKSLERLGHWPGRILLRLIRLALRDWPEPVYALRRRLGLPRGLQPIIDGQHSPSLVLAMYSRVLGGPQPDWPPHAVITGHAFHDAPHGTGLEPELDGFLAAGPPPIVFTLGSSVVLVAEAFWEESIAAVRRIGARAVLLAGPRMASAVRDQVRRAGAPGGNMIVVERAPHSLLFPRASVVVQQCGIGTLAQSLRSGRPMLGVPHAHDQPDNAWRAARLRMSRTMAPRGYRAASVAKVLADLAGSASYADAAARVAAVVGSERGVQAACDAIEQTFALSGSRRLAR